MASPSRRFTELHGEERRGMDRFGFKVHLEP